MMTGSNMTLLDLLTYSSNENDVAILAPGKPKLTYSQLFQNITQLSAVLNGFGIGRKNRVAIVMSNGPEMLISFLAVAMCSIALPLNPKYKKEEFAFYFEDTNPCALITLEGGAPLAHEVATEGMQIIQALPNADGTVSFKLLKGYRDPHPIAKADSSDIAMILHTSGTTSRPKRVPLRHSNLVASAMNIKKAYQLTSSDCSLCIMPLFHIHGIVGAALSTFASGGSLICPDGFHMSEFWELITTYRPTWYTAVPTIHQIILTSVDKNQETIKKNPFRFIRSCSSSLPPIILERLEEAFHAPVLEAYGMTEASHQVASNPLPPAKHKSGSVGIGFGVEIGIMDEKGNLLENGNIGEIVIKGANVFQEYDHNHKANAESFVNGWFRTGDQGRMDPEGYLFITGRLKEIINRGGEKISPFEIDDVLLRHPAVAEAVAFAVPSKKYGEEVHAAIVLKDHVDEEELRSYCLAHLANFKVPAKFHILTNIPRGATGKIQRIKMAQLLGISS